MGMHKIHEENIQMMRQAMHLTQRSQAATENQIYSWLLNEMAQQKEFLLPGQLLFLLRNAHQNVAPELKAALDHLSENEIIGNLQMLGPGRFSYDKRGNRFEKTSRHPVIEHFYKSGWRVEICFFGMRPLDILINGVPYQIRVPKYGYKLAAGT